MQTAATMGTNLNIKKWGIKKKNTVYFLYEKMHIYLKYSTFHSIRESCNVRDLVQGSFIPPVHLRDGFAARGLDYDYNGSSQHAYPAQPKQDKKHPTGSHPSTEKDESLREKCKDSHLYCATSQYKTII